MKLVLVRPPFYSLFGVTTPKMKTYPLNLLYLGTYVKEKTDWDVMIFDGENVDNKDDQSPVLLGADPELVMNAQIPRMEALLNNSDHQFWSQIESEIISSAPDLVGITCNSGNMDTVRIMVNRLRKRNIPVVLGGSHPTALPEQSLFYTSADMAIVGEGELSLVGLLQALQGKTDLSVVKSLSWKQNGKIRINPKAVLIPDINTLPIPDRSLIQRNKYYGEVIMTGRGCPFNCAYCASRNI